MSKAEVLRALVKQRLNAAAEEIFALFERTMEEYEQEIRLHRSRQPDGHAAESRGGPHGSPLSPTKFTADKGASQEQKSPGLHRESPEPPRVKNEREGLWTNQPGERPGVHEDLTIIPVTVKIEEEVEESTQSPDLLHTRSELSSHQLQARAGGEDRAEPEAARNLHPQPVRTSSDTGAPEDAPVQSGKPPSEDAVRDAGSNLAKKPYSCSECGKRFGGKNHLQSHMKSHTGEKTCPFCGKKISKSSNFTTHLRVHTGEKPFTCSVCNTSFSLRNTLVNHMRVHTGEKPFSCSVCAKKFTNKANVITHMAVHSEEKPFKCNVCDKRFTWHSQVKKHKCVAESSKT